MNPIRSLLFLALIALVGVGCVPKADEPVDVTAAYDAYGTAIMVDGAVPVQAVVAEAERYVNGEVKLEGLVTEVCQNAGCWLTMTDDTGTIVRIDVPRDADGVYVYTFPKDIAGRRAILAGRLAWAEDAPHEHVGEAAEGEAHEHGDTMADEAHEHGDAMADGEAHSDREADVMAKTRLTLIAEGALVERVRT